MSATMQDARPGSNDRAAVRHRFATRATRGGAVAPGARPVAEPDARPVAEPDARPAAEPDARSLAEAAAAPHRDAMPWPAPTPRPSPEAAPAGAASMLLSKLRTAAPILLASAASAAQAEAGDRVIRDLNRRVDAAIQNFLRETGFVAAGLAPAQRALVQDLALGLRPDRTRIVEAVARALTPVDAVAMLAVTGIGAGSGWASDALRARGRQTTEACLDVAHHGVTDGARTVIERTTASILLDALLRHAGLTEETRSALRAGPAAND